MLKAAFIGIFMIVNSQGVPVVEPYVGPFDSLLECEAAISNGQKELRSRQGKEGSFDRDLSAIGICIDSKDIN